jgi:hypothetical protein
MKRLVLILLITVLAVIPALGTTHNVTIQPDGAGSKDAGIWEANPDTNYGDYEYFWVGYDGGYAFSLKKFNGLDAYAGATVTYAELNLYCYDEWGILGDGNRVLRIDGSWDEVTVTWNNRPPYESTMWEAFNAPTVDDWLSVDVTAMVQSWLDGSYPHYGFYIRCPQTAAGGWYFYSGESTEDILRPYIYMEYEYTGVAPASLGEIKANFR